MKALLGLVALLIALPAFSETVAVTGAKAWTMSGDDPIENATIIVKDQRIASVTPSGAVPAGARVIAANGQVVTPALMSARTQIGLSEGGGADADGSVAAGPLGAAFDISYAIDANAQTVQQARADGVARAMVFPGGSGGAPFSGRGALVRLIPNGNIVEQPRAAMFAVIGANSGSAVGGSRAAAWQLLRNALDEATLYQKTPRAGGPRDQLLNHLDAAALGAVLSGAIPLAIEADRESDIRQAIELARDYPLRVVLLGGAEAWRTASQLAAAHIPVILDPMDDLPTSYDRIGARPDNAALLAQAGVTLAFSVSGQGIYLSYNAGPSMREGAGIAVSHGLPYRAALQAITLGAARIWGLESHSGALAAGRDADLVIWDGDPLEPATAPVLVMIAGREISLITRQMLLRERYAPPSK